MKRYIVRQYKIEGFTLDFLKTCLVWYFKKEIKKKMTIDETILDSETFFDFFFLEGYILKK